MTVSTDPEGLVLGAFLRSSGQLYGERLILSGMGAMGVHRSVAAAGRLNIAPCHVGQIGPMTEGAGALFGMAALTQQIAEEKST